MASNAWHIRGDYFETCNCDYVCPCVPSNMAASPTNGTCIAALVFHIDEGHMQETTLAGLNFAVLLSTPGPMRDGNWSVGLITDSAATPEQQQALVTIASGQAGGPMAPLGALITDFRGAEARPIQYEKSGLTRSVAIPGVLAQAVEGVPSAVANDEPLYIENVAHPANRRLALGHATRSHLHAFGLNWDETSGKNNGHFASFDWRPR